MSIKKYCCLALCAAILASCEAPKKVPYMVDAEGIPSEVLSRLPAVKDPVITAGDLLNIKVYASNPAAVAQFNKNQYVNPDGSVASLNSSNNTAGVSSESQTDFYLVDSNGNIEFPTLGLIHVAGLTKQQVADDIKSAIYPKYIKIQPSVDIRLMNFKVTVLGQVGAPGVITSNNERMNLFEAIAKAGDLEIRGDRENVLLLRTNADGTREVHRLNLHDRNILLSPYYNLQQNDFIYVTPNRSAAQSAWQMHQGWTTAISIVGGASAVATLVISIINLSK